jgi:thiamine monophosphate synthase
VVMARLIGRGKAIGVSVERRAEAMAAAGL